MCESPLIPPHFHSFELSNVRTPVRFALCVFQACLVGGTRAAGRDPHIQELDGSEGLGDHLTALLNTSYESAKLDPLPLPTAPRACPRALPLASAQHHHFDEREKASGRRGGGGSRRFDL